MLRILRIENIAVAREVELELGRGFSVLTGETGAGKSILIDGLTLVLGGRISKDMIRPGEKNAFVTAIFPMLRIFCLSLTVSEYIPTKKEKSRYGVYFPKTAKAVRK